MKRIPFKNFSSFDMEITLDDIPFIVKFNWNSRGEFWVMSFYDRDGVSLVVGIKIVINQELVTQFVDKGLPPGEIHAIRENFSHDRLTQNEFIDNTADLVYITEAEIVGI